MQTLLSSASLRADVHNEVVSIFMSKERSGLRMTFDEVVSIFMSKERSGLLSFYNYLRFSIIISLYFVIFFIFLLFSIKFPFPFADIPYK